MEWGGQGGRPDTSLGREGGGHLYAFNIRSVPGGINGCCSVLVASPSALLCVEGILGGCGIGVETGGREGVGCTSEEGGGMGVAWCIMEGWGWEVVRRLTSDFLLLLEEGVD